MSTCIPTLVITGDVCIDWLQWSSEPADQGFNWQLYDSTHRTDLPGGALLLAKLLRRAGGVDVRAPIMGHTADIPLLQSLAEIKPFLLTSVKEEKSKVYRIASYRGYTGVNNGAPGLLPIVDDIYDPDLVILDDAGNGFRDQPEFWPAALNNPDLKAWIIYKMSRPLLEGKLWEKLGSIDSERLVIVVNADHLRETDVNLNRRLSWERTAKDFVWQIGCNPRLALLAKARHLIVRFGLEGALYYQGILGGPVSRLFFDPALIEDGYTDQYPGEMQGYSDAFIAALAWTLACPPNIAVEKNDEVKADLFAKGILAGLRAARRMLKLGYGHLDEIDKFPNEAILNPSHDEKAEYLAEVVIPNPERPEPPDPSHWSILKDIHSLELIDLAEDLVISGSTEALRGVPVGVFGNLRSADRAEIEGFRTIRNLIDEYLNGANPKPLSIAVFGSPGSGKSFSVTEVAESVTSRQPVKRMDFNLTQFRSPDDLIRAFHTMRDYTLKGFVPLVFFDEFDADYNGKLGWLKFFLSPMQDGIFREGETDHPIGRAIFVFAGGTFSSYDTFASLSQPCDDPKTSEEEKKLHALFRDMKGPDFISRLRGFVNIMGPNPLKNQEDAAHIVRRAVLLRSLIERKAKQILTKDRVARIDEGVLRAMLLIPEYRHGARSMEAILDMSMLTGRQKWEQAALPPTEQLELHVDAVIFVRLMLRPVILTRARDLLGQAVHQVFLQERAGTLRPDNPRMQPWDKLSDEFKESNMQVADHIAIKLRAIGCDMLPVEGRPPKLIKFSETEIEKMGIMEHDRWWQERLDNGWTYGRDRDDEKKTNPYLVPFNELEEKIKDLDRASVKNIPELLAMVKFEIKRVGKAK